MSNEATRGARKPQQTLATCSHSCAWRPHSIADRSDPARIDRRRTSFGGSVSACAHSGGALHYGINAFWRSVQTTPSRLKASRITPRGRQSEKISSARPRSLPISVQTVTALTRARAFQHPEARPPLHSRPSSGRLWARPIGRRFRSSCPFDAGNGRPRRRRGNSTGVGRGQWEASNANDLSTSSTVCTRQ